MNLQIKTLEGAAGSAADPQAGDSEAGAGQESGGGAVAVRQLQKPDHQRRRDESTHGRVQVRRGQNPAYSLCMHT